MKKFLWMMPLLALSVISFTGCSSDNDCSTTPELSNPNYFLLGTSTSYTRAFSGDANKENMNIAIKQGQKVYVWFCDDPTKTSPEWSQMRLFQGPFGTVVGGVGGLFTDLASAQTGNDVNIARVNYPDNGTVYLYGMSAGDGTLSHDFAASWPNDVTFQVEGDQSNVNGDGYYASDLVYCMGEKSMRTEIKTGNYVQLKFKHMMTKIVIEINHSFGAEAGQMNPTKLWLNNVQLNKKFSFARATTADPSKKIDVNDYVPTAIEPASIVRGNVMMTSEIGSDNNFAIIAPQTIPTGTALFTFNNDTGSAGEHVTSYTYRTTQNITFESGKVYKFIVTMKASGVEGVVTSVEDWDTGETFVSDVDID